MKRRTFFAALAGLFLGAVPEVLRIVPTFSSQEDIAFASLGLVPDWTATLWQDSTVTDFENNAWFRYVDHRSNCMSDER